MVELHGREGVCFSVYGLGFFNDDERPQRRQELGFQRRADKSDALRSGEVDFSDERGLARCFGTCPLELICLMGGGSLETLEIAGFAQHPE